MNTSTIIEAVGYLGSALVLVSFLMSSVVKLRVVNTIGSVIFAVYALIIRSYPTAVMNFCLVCINLHFLWKLRRQDPSYRLLALQPREGYVQDFLRQNAAEIASFFPDRRPEQADPNRAYMVFHGAEPAGILLGNEADGVLDVALDYSTPAYRDCSLCWKSCRVRCVCATTARRRLISPISNASASRKMTASGKSSSETEALDGFIERLSGFCARTALGA